MAELLFWPAFLAYGEAAVAYAGDARRPGSMGRLATWGVRIGWLVQTALLIVQAAACGRVPVGHVGRVAQSLRLARRRRVPDLGLQAALPAARARGDAPRRAPAGVSYAAGGMDVSGTSKYSSLFLGLHVGLVLAGFAGLTLAAALAALYLWQERELKRRSSTVLRFRAAVARDAREPVRADGRVLAARC